MNLVALPVAAVTDARRLEIIGRNSPQAAADGARLTLEHCVTNACDRAEAAEAIRRLMEAYVPAELLAEALR